MKIIRTEKLTDYPHLNLFNITYLDRSGEPKSWYIASRDSEPKCTSRRFAVPDGVIIVPFHKEQKKLVVIKEFRVALGDYKYGFPAGLVDDGETAEEAAARELKEETGLTLEKVLKISPPIFSSTGMTDETTSIVYVACSGTVSLDKNSSTEEIEVFFVSQEEAAALCWNPDLKFDAKAWLVISGFAEHGRI